MPSEPPGSFGSVTFLRGNVTWHNSNEKVRLVPGIQAGLRASVAFKVTSHAVLPAPPLPCHPYLLPSWYGFALAASGVLWPMSP